MRTLLLDQARWDVILDAAGDIAVASEPYAIAQDAGSAIKLFAGELWYDTTKGIPYFQQVLGFYPPAQLLKTYFTDAALTVPGVVSALCFFSGLTDRGLSGQVLVTDNEGVTSIAGF